MTAAPIQIRKPEVVSDIRELAELKGQPITEAVAEAVRAELRRARGKASLAARQAQVEAIVRHFNALPNVGPRLTDDDLYDEDGLPR
jgi:hypothetical protein